MFKMTDSDYRRPQAVETHELDLLTVQVILDIKDLRISVFKKEPENAKVEYSFGERSFQVTAELENKDKTVTKYKQVIRKLPGPIDKNKCEVKFEKGKIILILKKSEESSWEVYLKKNLLEQDVEMD